MPPPSRLPPTIPHLTSCWWRPKPNTSEERGQDGGRLYTWGPKAGDTKRCCLFPTVPTPCCHPLLVTAAHKGPGHREKPHLPIPDTVPCKQEGDCPPLNHSDPTPSPRTALLLKLKLEGGNECLPGPRSTLNSVAQQVQDAGSLPAPPALLWGTLPVHQVSSRGGQVPTRHSAQQLQGCLAELESLK